MIGLDTNVLLRYLVQDDPAQSPKASEVIERHLSKQNPGFVSLVCVLEIVWVLGSLYKRSRAQIADHVEMLLAADTLEVQNEQEVYQAVVALRNGAGTFEDALVGALGVWRGCSATLTFDQNAAKRLMGFQLL
ncbi:MAG: type II toxin-antitoxin system VapC family toxin [Acidobacteriota bacterium]|nr:type II toxin-antitoxin system VapC family toxin [Acidobacteriota bacterium]